MADYSDSLQLTDDSFDYDSQSEEESSSLLSSYNDDNPRDIYNNILRNQISCTEDNPLCIPTDYKYYIEKFYSILGYKNLNGQNEHMIKIALSHVVDSDPEKAIGLCDLFLHSRNVCITWDVLPESGLTFTGTNIHPDTENLIRVNSFYVSKESSRGTHRVIHKRHTGMPNIYQDTEYKPEYREDFKCSIQ